MKHILFTLALTAAAAMATEAQPAQILADSPNPQRYLYGATRVPGTVKLKLLIDHNGKLRRVEVLEGRPELVASAIRMMYDYRFAPAQADGKPVASDMNIDLNFRFDNQ